MNPLFAFDLACETRLLAGVDEAGRGPLAGPVYAAAVVLDYKNISGLQKINDSKKLSSALRKELSALIRERALGWAIASADHIEIDKMNILQASLLAMDRALGQLKTPWDLCLVDGNCRIPALAPEKQRPVVAGDAKSACIAAASILAKVARDEIMERFHEQFPGYEFARHKGYATPGHIRLLKQHGPCPIHRMTFCKKFLAGVSPAPAGS